MGVSRCHFRSELEGRQKVHKPYSGKGNNKTVNLPLTSWMTLVEGFHLYDPQFSTAIFYLDKARETLVCSKYSINLLLLLFL